MANKDIIVKEKEYILHQIKLKVSVLMLMELLQLTQLPCQFMMVIHIRARLNQDSQVRNKDNLMVKMNRDIENMEKKMINIDKEILIMKKMKMILMKEKEEMMNVE